MTCPIVAKEVSEWMYAAWHASVASSSDPEAAVSLAQLMSDISEDCYCASWLIGTEFTLWQFAQGGHGDWGFFEVTSEQATELRELSAKAGGWVAWPSQALDDGLIFVPAEAWTEMFAERRAHENRLRAAGVGQ
jgi:hypothetical protein